jgi:hypothetical protein
MSAKVEVINRTTEHMEVEPEPEQDSRKSASTLLVEIAMEKFSFGVSTTGETFAIPRAGQKVVRLLRGSKTSLRSMLAREYFQRYAKAATQQALADSLMVLEGLAQQGDEEELHLRVASIASQEFVTAPSVLWLDLGDPTGRAIKITAQDWTIEPEAPVLFKRTVLMASLPTPDPTGSLDSFWMWLNVEAADRPLILAWLVAALMPDIPHPVLALTGEQGTGKTTFMRIMVLLIDPGPVPVRKPPKDSEGWVTAAAGSWLVGLDNLSAVPDWLSDSLCRAVTGEGDVRRKLYTDGDHAVFNFRRCVLLTSIDPGAIRGDLAERILPVKLDIIPDSERLLESEIWPAWKQAHPQILGGILDLAARVIAVLPSVQIGSKPRMADFARIVGAVDQVLGTDGLTHYIGKQTSLATDSLDGDSFITELAKINTFDGTASELLDKITPDKPPKGWPANARSVTQRLRRQAPVMRKAGWQVTDDGGRNHRNALCWRIIRPEMVRNSYSQDSHTRQNDPEREPASVASQDSEPSSYDREVDL